MLAQERFEDLLLLSTSSLQIIIEKLSLSTSLHGLLHLCNSAVQTSLLLHAKVVKVCVSAKHMLLGYISMCSIRRPVIITLVKGASENQWGVFPLPTITVKDIRDRELHTRMGNPFGQPSNTVIPTSVILHPTSHSHPNIFQHSHPIIYFFVTKENKKY